MKMFKALLLTCFVMVTTALTVFSQPSVGTAGSGSSYLPVLIPLPTTYLLQGATGTTNFYFGYTNTTYATNILGPLYTNSLNGGGSPGFYYATNYITNNVVTYPYVYIPKQTRLALEYHGETSSGGGTNTVQLSFARSVSGLPGSADQTTPFTWQFSVGPTNTCAITNLPSDYIGSCGYLFLYAQTILSTNGGNLTNITSPGYSGPGVIAGIKPAAP